MSARDLSFMQALCPDDEFRPDLAKPFLVTVDGEAWAVATNGHGLLALRQENTFAPGSEKRVAGVTKLLQDAKAASLESLDFVALRQWCATRFRPNCDACHGSGTAPCACPACGHAHTAVCGVCELTEGTSGHGRAGRFHGRRVNRGIVANWLGWLPPDAVVRGGHAAPHPETPIVFAGDDWFVLVMPTRDIEGMAGEVEFPALVTESAT